MFKSGKLLVVIMSLMAVSLFAGVFTAYASVETCNGQIEGYSCNNVPTAPYPSEVSESCIPTDVNKNGFMSPLGEGDYIHKLFDDGWVKGHDNINAGTTEFNSHPESGYYASPSPDPYYANLDIVEAGKVGYAPSTVGIAACLDGDGKDFNNLDNQQFPVKGYAWNTNLGFISFGCESGFNLGQPCGDYDYHTTLDEADIDEEGNEFRSFAEGSYAWNPTFGYVSFKGEGVGSESFIGSYSPVKLVVWIADPFTGVLKEYVQEFNDKFVYVCDKNLSGQEITADGQTVFCADGKNGFDWALIETYAGSKQTVDKRWSVLLRTDKFKNQQDVESWVVANYPAVAGKFDVVAQFLDQSYDSVYPLDLNNYEMLPPEGGAFVDQSKTNYLKRTPDFTYGVIAEKDSDSPWWYLKGWGYTNAGVYLNFDGVRLQLSHSTEGCEGVNGICFDIIPDPLTREFNYSYVFDGDNDPELFSPVADGEDGYRLVVFPNDSSGAEIDLTQKAVKITSVVWNDTIKRDQTQDENLDFSSKESPWDVGGGEGAVGYKPLDLSEYPLKAGTFSEPTSGGCEDDADWGEKYWCKQDFEDGTGYVFKDKITSYAPTSDANVSATTGTSTHSLVYNEDFALTDGFYSEEADKKTVENKNYLLLRSVNWALENIDGSDSVEGDFDYGDLPLSLSFRPAIYMDRLYANEDEDYLTEFAGIPTLFEMGLEGAVDGATDVKLQLYLNYARNADMSEYCASSPNSGLVVSFQDDSYPPFEFSPSGTESSSLLLPDEAGAGERDREVLQGDPPVLQIVHETNSELPIIDTINELFTGTLRMFVSFAFPESGDICDQFDGSLLYSEIQYKVDSKDVKYYSNKLPRLPNMLTDAGAYITGNISSQYVKGTASQNVSPLYSTSDKVLNDVRDAISENLGKELGSSDVGVCTDILSVDSLESLFNGEGTNGCGARREVGIRQDKVLYLPFNGDGGSVHLQLDSSGMFGNDDIAYVLIVKGANVYIDSSIFGDAVPSNFTIVALKEGSDDIGTSGNIFVKYDVRNINATVFADGVVMSYLPDSGNPKVDFKMTQLLEGIEEYKQSGLSMPLAEVAAMVSELIDGLKENGYQLSWQGGIVSRNTIGGAATDVLKEYQTYFGKGNLPEKDRGVAQLFDLNYLRFFRLAPARCPAVEPQGNTELDCGVEIIDPITGEVINSSRWTEGLVIDQQCQKGLTNQMLAQIALDFDSVKNSKNGATCNGIDPTRSVVEGGDLVPTVDDDSKFAEGLYNVEDATGLCVLREEGDVPNCIENPDQCAICQYGPEYINYIEVPGSFLFKTQ